ncbi:MAG TPA: outer membrane lipid asymmetry maintenance protein MlaD [Thermodesulfovibrionales bacterium]|jgi:phospholipid/cholesterol/gamma-HCH transport system substrate-binding protein|nr:outer membrane lipid asymmetry maintenance protein MlaD [Thermodesulfovibrionales bacterium]
MHRKTFDLDMAVGLFLVIGIICLAYISIKLGRLEVIGTRYYTVYADFAKAGGIKAGSSVEIAGVEVGKVKSVRLDKDYQARVALNLNTAVKIQEDAIASVKTKGLIGERYVEITPGASDAMISAGGKIRETESAIDVEEIISKYAFGKV